MRKINLIFTSLIAMLIFFTIWNAFNFSYHFRIAFFENERIQKGDLIHVNTIISTHAIEDMPEFKKSLVNFFYKNDTIGRIHHIIVEEDLRQIMHFYNYADASESLFLFNLKPGVPLIDWKSRDEYTYYTNDGSSENPNLIDYLDASYYDYRDGIYRHTLNFYPMHHFENVNNQRISKSQVFVDLYMPVHDVERVQKQFVKEVLVPIGYSALENGIDEGIFIDFTHTDLNAHNDYPLNGISWTSNWNEMPKPLLMISLFTLLLINIQYMFRQSKEIQIRKLNGNKDRIIFKRIVSKILLESIGTFITTLLLLWLYYVRSFRPIARLFTNQVLLIVVIYVLMIAALSVALYGYLIMKNSVLMLKKNFDLKLVTLLSTIAKVAAVTVVVVPIMSNIRTVYYESRALAQMKENTGFLESVGVGEYTSTYSIGTNLEIKEKFQAIEAQNRIDLIELIHTQKLQLVDLMAPSLIDMTSYKQQNIPKALVNNYHIETYAFEIDGKKIDLSDKTSNYILVPDQYKNIEPQKIESFETSEVLIVDDTFTHLMNHAIDVEAPMLYVIVDNYDVYTSFNDTLRKRVTTSKALDDFNKAFDTYNLESAQFTRLNQKDVYDETLELLNIANQKTYPLIGVAFFVTTLFSYLMATSYIQIFKKILAIKYIHGKSLLERYGFLFLLYACSTFAVVYILSKHNKTIESLDFKTPRIHVEHLVLIAGILIVIDVFNVVLAIRKFNKNNVASILKGDGE